MPSSALKSPALFVDFVDLARRLDKKWGPYDAFLMERLLALRTTAESELRKQSGYPNPAVVDDVAGGYLTELMLLYDAYIAFVKQPTAARAAAMHDNTSACALWTADRANRGDYLGAEWTAWLISLPIAAEIIADELVEFMAATNEPAAQAKAAERADRMAAELLAEENAGGCAATKPKKQKRKKKKRKDRLPGRLRRSLAEARGGVE